MRTYQNPLLPFEAKHVLDETKAKDFTSYEQRRFISDNVLKHSISNNYDGLYFLQDEKSTHSCKKGHDLGSILTACQEQITRLDKPAFLDSLRDRLHRKMNKLPVIGCEAIEESTLTVYGADGEYDKIEISIQVDGAQGPRLGVELSNQSIIGLMNQLEIAKDIIMTNKFDAKTVD